MRRLFHLIRTPGSAERSLSVLRNVSQGQRGFWFVSRHGGIAFISRELVSRVDSSHYGTTRVSPPEVDFRRETYDVGGISTIRARFDELSDERALLDTAIPAACSICRTRSAESRRVPSASAEIPGEGGECEVRKNHALPIPRRGTIAAGACRPGSRSCGWTLPESERRGCFHFTSRGCV